MKKLLPASLRVLLAVGFFVLLTNHSVMAQSSDATLQDISLDGVSIDNFAPTILNYSEVLPYGSIYPKTVTATPKSSHGIAAITQAATVNDKAIIVVTAQDGTTTKTYTVQFSVFPFPSTDASLKDLLVGGVSIAGFDRKTFNYNVTLPYGSTNAPQVSVVLNESHASPVITQAASAPGTATVVVTAQDGTTKTNFTVNFNIAPPLTDATLSDLKVGATTLTGFVPGTLTYDVVLPAGTTIKPLISATVTEPHATTQVTQAASVTGTATVMVTAQDGTTVNTYTVNFSVASTDATLSDLKVGAGSLTGFAPGTLSYDVVLPSGTTLPPSVSATITEPHAKAVITQAASVNGSAKVVVTAQDGTTANTYTVHFSVASTVATLSDLKVGSSSVAGFVPGIASYDVVLPAGTTILPVVTATVSEPHATALITQAASVTGSATVVVTAQDGTTVNTYTVNFSVASQVATLSDLKVGTSTVAGFASGIASYDVVLPTGTTLLPVVTATVTEPHATAVINQATSVTGSATVVVTAQDGVSVATYTVHFSVLTGVDELQANELKINKQGNILRLALPDKIKDLQVFTLEGKVILFKKVENTQTSVNTADWDPGVYILKINAQPGRYTKKINIVR